MKKLLGIVVLGLLLSGGAYSETKVFIPEPIDKNINAHVRAGYKIIDVSATDQIAVYTLQKKKQIKVCYLIVGTDKIIDCVYP